MVTFPGNNDCGQTKDATLREAARLHSVHGNEVAFCICRKSKVKCTSRCHKGCKCSNGEEFTPYAINQKFILPSWGGKYNCKGCLTYFTNTCPVDNWFMLLKAASFLYPPLFIEILNTHFTKYSDFIVILGLIQKAYYNVAIYRLAILHNLSMNKNCFVQLLLIFTSHHMSIHGT